VAQFCFIDGELKLELSCPYFVDPNGSLQEVVRVCTEVLAPDALKVAGREDAVAEADQ
jgi:hypothetical protein